MKKFALTLTVTFLAILTYGQDDAIRFIQGDSTFSISEDLDTITLQRKPFSIRYFAKKYKEKNERFYSAQIAVLDKEKDMTQAAIGQKLSSIPYFEPGSGMAPGYSGLYDTIYITNSGHHYLVYENEKDRRVNLISKKSGMLELEWSIKAAHYKNKEGVFSELSLNELFFVILTDKNLNGVIDKGELKKVRVRLK